MCTFFVKKPKQNLSKEHFTTIIDNNPNGFGFVYTTGTKLMIVKSAKPNAESLWKKYSDAVAKHPESNFIGHGRIATGSNIDYENTHPFMVNKQLVFVHNGIIRQFPSTAKRSDTYQYMEQVLRKLPRDFYKNKSIMDLISRDIVGSKFAFLTLDNKVYIVNAHACVTDKETGVLFSNNNYKPSEYIDYGGTQILKGYSKYKDDFGWSKGYSKYKMDAETIDYNSSFHIDKDKAEIVPQNDWVHCLDCDDWVHENTFIKKHDCCRVCAKSYGFLDDKGNDTNIKDEGLSYCDDCDFNVASHKYEGFNVCDLCASNYEGASPMLKQGELFYNQDDNI
jgi:hypothetical protein